MSIIQLVELAFDYQEVPLLHGINFQLDAGDLLHIQGANGAGKTTLLKLLAGLHQPSHGEIKYKGNLIHDNLADYQHNLCFVGHKTGISPYLTIQENCYFDPQYRPNCELDEPIAAFQLNKHLTSLCGALSAGQKRKVGLLRLWFSAAALWLLDEPFVALDEQALTVLINKIKQHREKGGVVILTSHQRLPLDASTYRNYFL
jgi:heme exporter protein A